MVLVVKFCVRFGKRRFLFSVFFMSCLGKKPIFLPPETSVDVSDNVIVVTGPRGVLRVPLSAGLSVLVEGRRVKVVPKEGFSSSVSAMWGTTARNLENAINGVSVGYQKVLELNGVGYRMAVKGKVLEFALGFSHPVVLNIPENLSVSVMDNQLTVSGISKEVVGKFSSEIRSLRPVEPYKGKGFRYRGEVVRRKEGKKSST